MHPVVVGVHWDAGCRTHRHQRHMTRITFRRGADLGAVVSAFESASFVAEGAVVRRGVHGVMMDGTGRVGRGVMTDQAAIGNRGAEDGIAIRAGPASATTLRIDMAESTEVFVGSCDDIRTRMATAAFRIGYEVGRLVTTMEIGPIRMAIQATYSQIVILNNCLDAGISGLDIDRAGRVMARGAGTLMEGVDTGCTAPGITELLGGHAANAMTGVAEGTV